MKINILQIIIRRNNPQIAASSKQTLPQPIYKLVFGHKAEANEGECYYTV